MATNWTVAADQDSVDQVSAKIGESSDNESKATVFGKMWGIRNVVDWLKTNFTSFRASLTDARIAKLDNLDGKISGLPQGVIKSMQRGNVYITSREIGYTVNMAPVNVDKSIILLNVALGGAISQLKPLSSTSPNPFAVFINSTSFRAGVYFGGSDVNIWWQVIEFY